jgi:hypothetical protein
VFKDQPMVTAFGSVSIFRGHGPLQVLMMSLFISFCCRSWPCLRQRLSKLGAKYGYPEDRPMAGLAPLPMRERMGTGPGGPPSGAKQDRVGVWLKVQLAGGAKGQPTGQKSDIFFQIDEPAAIESQGFEKGK